MVKKQSKQKEKVEKNEIDSSQDLYIRLRDMGSKRKELLQGLRTSLVIQEEIEQVSAIRNERFSNLEEIKKHVSEINTSYNKLQKLLPNMRSVISYVSKEASSLESQIRLLASDKKVINEEISELKDMKRSVHPISSISKKELKSTTKKESTSTSHNRRQSLSKLDRIKNNLSIIENKLKEL